MNLSKKAGRDEKANKDRALGRVAGWASVWSLWTTSWSPDSVIWSLIHRPTQKTPHIFVRPKERRPLNARCIPTINYNHQLLHQPLTARSRSEIATRGCMLRTYFSLWCCLASDDVIKMKEFFLMSWKGIHLTKLFVKGIKHTKTLCFAPSTNIGSCKNLLM